MTGLRDIQTDVAAARLSAQGAEDFLFPLASGEVAAVRDAFLGGFHDLLRRLPPDRGSAAEAAWIGMSVLVQDVMQAYQAVALINRLGPAGCRPVGAFVSQLAAGTVPPPSRVLAGFLGRPVVAPWSRRVGRSVLGAFRARVPFAYLPPLRVLGADEPICFFRSPVMERYAAMTGAVPSMSRLDDWLTRPLPPDDGLDAETADALRQVFRAAFAEGGEDLPAAAESWLLRSAQLASGWARRQLAHLRARPRLPGRIWVGALGNLMYRTLARVVRERGGEVTGFDHGISTGLWETSAQTTLEFDSVDRFVTFAPGMAEGLRANHRPDHSLCGERLPDIVSVTRVGAPPVPAAPSPLGFSRIIYSSTCFSGERVHILPFLTDVQLADWQCRLLAHLRSRGIEVWYKPHPENVVPVPDAITALVDGRMLDGRFEQLDLRDTLILYDYPQSSTFRHAVMSGCPIAIVDLQRLPIRPEARPLLEARCAMATGRMDAAGRLNVDWDELGAALTRAPTLTDGRLADRYFNGA